MMGGVSSLKASLSQTIIIGLVEYWVETQVDLLGRLEYQLAVNA